MLVKCPECDHDISSKAVTCPSCGFPILPRKYKSPKQSRRMNLPNGFGRITELRNRNLRKPFRAMISEGKDENGRPIGRLLKPVAYFKTYNEAYQALIEYHKNPYNYENNLSMQELYEKWFEYHSPKVSTSRHYSIKASWDYCAPMIGNRLVQTIRTPDLKRVLDDGHKISKEGKTLYPSDNVKNTMKYTLSMMLDYAVEYGYIDRNYARDIKSGYGETGAANPHISYTKEEMAILWKYHETRPYAEMILFQCYSGFRPNELCNIRLGQINLTDWVIVGGSKTSSGKDRIVPIHNLMKPIIRKWYDQSLASGAMFLFTINHKHITYEVLKHRFKEEISFLNLNSAHRPHDARKQFVTMAKEAEVNEYAIKLIVGHAIKDLTERVYTTREIDWLHKEINKIGCTTDVRPY